VIEPVDAGLARSEESSSGDGDETGRLIETALRWGNRFAERVERAPVVSLLILSAAYWGMTLVLAARKLMWNDELYTFYISTLPTMRDVWEALMSRGEQTPPFFYMPTRLAFDLFGVNNISVRLPEMLGFCLMGWCVYVFVARRGFRLAALSAAAFPLVTAAYYYAFEARAYGMLLGFVALAAVCWQGVAVARLRALSLVGLAASLVAAVCTHYYAVFAILPLAAGEAVRTIGARRADLATWSVLALPAVPLALHLPLIRAGTAYSGAFWSPPQWINIPGFYTDLLEPAVVPAAAVLVLAGILAVVRATPHDPTKTGRLVPTHEIVAICGFLLIPFGCVVLAKLVTGAFTNRYAISTVIGFALLIGLGVARGFERLPVMRLVTVIALGTWFLLSGAREFVQPTGFSQPVSKIWIDRSVEWLRSLPDNDLPVVVADPHTFTVLVHHGPPDITSRLVYLADPDRALERLGHNSVERGMLDLVGPWFGMNVVRFEPFIAAHGRFLVFGNFGQQGFLNWIVPELRVRGMRTELLNQAGGDMLLSVSAGGRSNDATQPLSPAARR
jgi:hypothetical protein